MYCPQCGATNPDNAAFCGNCGTDVRKYQDQWSAAPEDAPGDAVPAGTSPADPAGDVPPPPEMTPDPEPAGGEIAPAEAAPASPEMPPPAAPTAPPPPYQPQYQAPPYQTPPPYQAAPGQQGYYPPAGYQQPGYPPAYNQGIVPHIPSYLGWAIATLILCFWPTGIVAVVYATKVGNLLAIGDVFGAQEASRKAKMWCWVTFGIALAGWVLAIIFIILAIAVWSTAITTVTY